MNLKEFQKIFKKAGLTEKEKEYFLEDAAEVVKNIDCKNALEYYNWEETQYCVIEYALPDWKEVAISGLKKILSYINS